MTNFDRITQDPSVMGGKACVRGLRVTVGMIVGQIGAGHTIEQILADYPYLERVDMNLSPRWVPLLINADWETVHWSSIGKGNAPDSEIMSYANA